jgi:hypothetical protein
MHRHPRGPQSPAQTEGRLVPWPALYDGIEDLPVLLKETGFEEIKQLDDHFLTIGFVRATKPGA